MRRLAGVLVLVAAFGGCGSKARPHEAASTGNCEPRPPATQKALGPDEPYQEQAGEWFVGRSPAFVSFAVLPRYRARANGEGSYVGIHRANGGPHGFGIKVMTIVAPRTAGVLVQGLRGIGRGTAGAAMSRMDEVTAIVRPVKRQTATLTPRSDPRVPGGLLVPGPGCYELTSRIAGKVSAIRFPVRFVPVPSSMASADGAR